MDRFSALDKQTKSYYLAKLKEAEEMYKEELKLYEETVGKTQSGLPS